MLQEMVVQGNRARPRVPLPVPSASSVWSPGCIVMPRVRGALCHPPEPFPRSHLHGSNCPAPTQRRLHFRVGWEMGQPPGGFAIPCSLL